MSTIDKYTHHQGTGTADDVDLSALLSELLGHKALIITSIVLALGVGAFIVSRQAPQYQSNVLLQLNSTQKAGFERPGLSLGGSQSDSASAHIALIKSRVTAIPVVKALGLNIMAFPTNQRSFWQRLWSPEKRSIDVSEFDLPEQDSGPYYLVEDRDNHIQLFDAHDRLILQGAVGSKLQADNGAISVYVNKVNAPVGTRFTLIKKPPVSAINAVLSDLNVTEVVGKAGIGTGILDVSKVGSDPIKVVSALNAIAKTVQIKDAERKAQEASKTLAFLKEQLPLAKLSLQTAEKSLNTHYKSKGGQAAVAMSKRLLTQQLANVQQQASALRVQRLDMRQHFTESHPAMKTLLSRQKTLEAERKLLEGKLFNFVSSDPISVNLQRDIQVKKELYIMLLNKLQEMEVAQAGIVSGVEILAEATPATLVNLHQSKIFMVSGFIGFIISLLWIFGQKLLFPRVEDPHWSEERFNIPNLAVINHCLEQTKNEEAFSKSQESHVPLLAHAKPQDLAIESLRSLRTSLQVSLAGANNNIVTILGISPGVGKSFVSANLGYLLAKAGKRVLLIDTDLRRGTLHRHMNSPVGPGMADLIDGNHSFDEVCAKNIYENLDFIPRGHYPSNPSELLMRPYFKELLHTFSNQYEIVLMDTPPILLVTDAALIAKLAGTNYMVFAAGVHQPTEIELAVKRFTGAGVQLHGSIFNFQRAEKFGRTHGKYGKYGRYSYQYYYDDSLKVK